MQLKNFVATLRQIKTIILPYLIVLPLLQFSIDAHATHFMGGELTTTRLDSQKIGIVLRLYEDCNGAFTFNNTQTIDIESYFCGLNTSITANLISLEDITPVCSTDSSSCNTLNGSLGIREYIYYTEYSFFSNSKFL